MLVARLNDGQSDYKTMGYLFQSTLYVDDSITEGLKAASFIAIKGDGKVSGLYGSETVATLEYATKTKRPVGVVYEESRESQYEGQLNMLSNSKNPVKNLLPYGNIEDRAIGMLRHGVITISNTENAKYRHFNTITKSLGAMTAQTAEVAVDAEFTIPVAKLAGCKVGDIILVGSDKKSAFIMKKDSTNFTLKNVSDEAISTSDTELSIKSALGEPVYLNEKQNVAGELPFTLDPSSGIKVGWVESTIHVRFNLDLAL